MSTYAKGCLRVGVIGCGLQGEKHLECYHAAPNATIVAVADVDEERAKQAGETYGVTHMCADYTALLVREDIDAVSIALPDHLHLEATLAAFSAQKHVLLEKPMATDVGEAEKMVQAWKLSGQKFMINQSNRWMLAFAQTKEALDAGELGDPLYCYARLSNTLYVPTQMLSWSAQTRLPHWLICHRLDIARWYFGCEAVRVNAVCRSRVLKEMGIDTPDFYQATIEFAGGQVANFESCWILPDSMPTVVDSKFQLICTDGYVNIDALQTPFHKATKEKYTLPGMLYGTVMGAPRGFVYDAVCHFVNCCLTDEEPLITGDDGLALTKTLCAVVDSAEKGEPVEIGR